MNRTRGIGIIIAILALGSWVFAQDCPPGTSYQVDQRVFLPDGSPNPTYGQEIATGECACVGFAPGLSVTQNSLTLTVVLVDHEPVRGLELNIYHDAPGLLLYSGIGSIGLGEKFANATDPDGEPQPMDIMANEVEDHVKILAYSRFKGQTSGDGSEGVVFNLTYGLPNGYESLPDSIQFGIGVCNVPGSSYEDAVMNVVCSYPDTSNMVGFEVPLLGVADELGIPQEYYLKQNYPNPFNPTTTVSFGLPEAGMTSVVVYNLLGQKVAVLANKFMEPGRYTFEWNANDISGTQVASGVYFYELRSGNHVDRKKMVLLR